MTSVSNSNNSDNIKNNSTTIGQPLSFNKILVKAKYSFYSTVVFFLFANPETLIIIQKILGSFINIVTPSGVPTLNGILVSSILFFITILTLMIIPLD